MNEHKKEYPFTEQKVRWVKKHTPNYFLSVSLAQRTLILLPVSLPN